MHVHEPTLLVRLDHVHAEFCMADGDTVEILETMTHPKKEYSDNEASNANAGNADKDETQEIHHFLKQVCEGMALLRREGDVDVIWIAAETELSRQLMEVLPADVKSHVQMTVEHNLMKEPLERVVERFHPSH